MRIPYRRGLARLALALAVVAPRFAQAQDTSAVQVTSRGIQVDFQDTDLRAVISALAEVGALNVTYGELPTRRVTLRLRQPIARTDVLPLLRSLAQSNGLRLVEDGPILRVEALVAGQGLGPSAPAAQQSAQQEELRLFVYRLKHARAAKLASTLQSIFGGRTDATPVAGISQAPLSDQLRAQRLAPNGADTSRAVAVTIGATRNGPSIPGSLQGQVQIVPDETTNSLLVRAQPTDYEVVRQAVEAMDLRPLQVLIEVLIAEVRRTKELDVGVSGSAKQTKNGNTTSGELKTSASNDFIVQLTRGGGISVDVAISALSSRGDVRILSRPVVLAQNNQEAKILVGSQRPFVQVSRSLPTDAGVRDQVIQYRDVGTSLTILPTINPDGYVNLQVQQEVSSATTETQFGAPVISTREASTHLFVRDGQTAVLGGLIDREKDNSRTGIPVLSSIPGIGALFGTTTNSTTNSELFLFLTPHIVATDDDADELRDQIEHMLPRLREEIRSNPPIAPLHDAAPPPRDSSSLGQAGKPRKP
ncbi:MAG TPA: secretin N-terminal domain-containing protein [Gemmatimonadaceae bacterium]|nr:secretin N-terminal domain-containing protein [Gemmatimonadaceae bacterium]